MERAQPDPTIPAAITEHAGRSSRSCEAGRSDDGAVAHASEEGSTMALAKGDASMTSWTSEELAKIGDAEELAIASRRPDGSLRPFVTIWVVRTAGDLYVRSVKGRSGSWFRAPWRLARAASEPAASSVMSPSRKQAPRSMPRSPRPTMRSTTATGRASSAPWCRRSPRGRPSGSSFASGARRGPPASARNHQTPATSTEELLNVGRRRGASSAPRVDRPPDA